MPWSGDRNTPQQTANSAVPPAIARVLQAIHDLRDREPDRVLPDLNGYHPHLFYHPGYCILCPAAGEDLATLRTALEERGYAVIVIYPHDDVAAVLGAYTFWRR